MRSESAIRHQLNQVRFRHRKKRVRKRLSRQPENCVFNEQAPKVTGCPRFCTNRNRSGLLCDSRYGGEQVAPQCPYFEAAYTADEVKEEFDVFLQTASKSELAREVPDLMALLWTLGDDNASGEGSVSETASEEATSVAAVVEDGDLMEEIPSYRAGEPIPAPKWSPQEDSEPNFSGTTVTHVREYPWYYPIIKWLFPRWVV